MGTSAFDIELFWLNGRPTGRIRRMERRLRRRADIFDQTAQRKLAAARKALARRGERPTPDKQR